MTNLDELLEFDENNIIMRHRTTSDNLDSILSTGVMVKPRERVRYTFEGIDSIMDTERSGYLAAQEKGDGATVDIYFQIPGDILDMYDAEVDDLRMSYSEYMTFITNYLYDLSDKERAGFKDAEMQLFLLSDDLELTNNSMLNVSNISFNDEKYLKYKRYKDQLSGNALKAINALEKFVIGRRYLSHMVTLIPSIFIKCYGNDDIGYQLNPGFYEYLSNQDKVIEGIIDHLVTNKHKVLQEQESSAIRL